MPIDPHAVGLAHHACVRPDKPALIMGGTVCTYAQLNTRVNRLANALRRAGIGVGGAVAAVLHNGIEWFEVLNAVGKLGAQLVPVGYRMQGPEIAYMVGDARAKVIVGDAALRDQIDRAMGELALGDAALWVIGDAPPWRGQSYETRLAAEDIAEPAGGFVGGGFNVLVYTSGTTGRPKGIDRTADPATAHLSILSIAHLWGFSDADVHLLAGPMYHTGPAGYATVHVLIGATVVLMPRFDAATALDLIERRRVTNTFMVPTHFGRILQLDEKDRRRDLSSLRLVLHSAAPCPAHVKRGIMEIFPPGSVTEFYGASESGFTKITAEEWLRKPGSVGTPWPGHTIRILDEQGGTLPAGEIGLIYVQAPLMNFRYRDAEEKNRGAFRDGCFTAGDLGYLDADGYLYIADRRTDLIISGGANIYPAEVEAVLLQHPHVADVAVIGVPDAEMGKSVLAVVEPRAGATLDEADLIAFARRALAHYKCPRRVVVVDTLPREPNGKVRKHELMRSYALTGFLVNATPGC